tara:strand:+ start:1303 stop:1959 length:657 start_codon:yes stop_codon:yes gene_type:complete
MSFYENDYSVYIFLGDPECKPLWHWESWLSVTPQLTDLINTCRGKAALRSNQYTSDGKLVRFGRMQWSEKSNEKWTYGSPAANIDESVKFLSTEAWAPSWGQCEKENQSPDLFISINNEALGGTPQNQLLFNPVIILAVEASVAAENMGLLDELTNKISAVTNSKLKVYKERKWGYKGLGGFTSAIQDLGSTGLFKPGKRHDRTLDLETFAEEWSIVP